MTTITLDDALLNDVAKVSHYKNIQEAVSKILADYVYQHKQEPPLFDQLRLANNYADDDIPLLFERNNDTGRTIEL